MALECSIDDIVKKLKDVAVLQIQSTLHVATAASIASDDSTTGTRMADTDATAAGTIPVSTDENFALTDRAISCLDALALRFPSRTHSTTDTNDEHDDDTDSATVPQSCHGASYTVLRTLDHDDEAVLASFSLLALIASSTDTAPQRAPDRNSKSDRTNDGLDVPIGSMRRALERTKQTADYRTDTHGRNDGAGANGGLSNADDAEERERISAELQRKACIYLGAIAEMDRTQEEWGVDDGAVGGGGRHGGTGLRNATSIVDDGGLEVILDSLMWFRFHVRVANWALWALFNICYDHGGNKKEFIRLNGINCVCTVLKCIMQNINGVEKEDDEEQLEMEEEREVTMQAVQHGIAILFDTMRFDDSNCENRNANAALHARSVQRKIALNAGISEVINTATRLFPKSTEIVMMGQQMLVTVVGSNININNGIGSNTSVPYQRSRTKRNPSIQM